MKLVGVGGGVAYGYLGPTHHAIEDIALMRALPNLTVLTPGDPHEAGRPRARRSRSTGPVYLRLGKNGEPRRAARGRPRSRSVVRAASATARDVTIVSCGPIADRGADGGRCAGRDGVAARVVHFGTSSRSTPQASSRRARGVDAIVTVEEHTVLGGLGSAVAEALAEAAAASGSGGSGMPDCFAHAVGSRDHLIRHYGLDAGAIAAAARRAHRLDHRKGGSMNPDIERDARPSAAAVRTRSPSSSPRTASRSSHAPLDRAAVGRRLLPVCELHADDERLISNLARWRASAQFAFPTRFPVSTRARAAGCAPACSTSPTVSCSWSATATATTSGTSDSHRRRGRADGSMEIDNVVRGERGLAPGLMGEALDALIAWAEELFAPERILLHVFDDNGHAIGFYRRHGFHDAGRVPLVRTVDGDREVFIPAGGERRRRRVPGDGATRPTEAPAGEQILTAGPSVSARESGYVLDAARTGWNARWSGYLDRLETTFADYVGAKHAIATSSCTGALHLAVAGAGIGPGDEVIVPELTWVATASAVLYRGGDADLRGRRAGLLVHRPGVHPSLITPRHGRSCPSHLYGHPAQADVICRIAAEHGLTRDRGRRAGDRRRAGGPPRRHLRRCRLLQLPGREAPGHRRGRHDRHGRRPVVDQIRSLWDQRPRPVPRFLDRRARVQVQDVATSRPRSAWPSWSASTS